MPANETQRTTALTRKAIDVFTDGACSGNPGPGGWGALLRYNGHERELYGGEDDTTNNRMELMAAIIALESLKERCTVNLYTDSKYVMDGMQKWLPNWKKNGWRTSAKKPVKNDDLWQRLDEAVSTQDVKWNWIRGHTGHEGNERADELARMGIPR